MPVCNARSMPPFCGMRSTSICMFGDGRRDDRRRAAVIDDQYVHRRTFLERREREIDIGLAVVRGHQHSDVVERILRGGGCIRHERNLKRM